ncbi:MAG: ATP-dependent protease La [Candidatus Midichloriaceae bacterium]|jgi:ATP-dependent Lon protease|nr:ATP-dependent protease La [Candidatus Midichloriaceae bacterium]
MKKSPQNTIPVLPLRDLVIFPGMIVPLFVGRDKSINALDVATEAGNKILLVAQKDANNDNPKTTELYKVGVVGQILQVLKLNDTTIKVLVEGKKRVKVTKYLTENNCHKAVVTDLEDEYSENPSELSALRRSISDLFENYVQLSPKVNPEVLTTLQMVDGLTKFADVVSSSLMIKVSHKQDILESTTLTKKLEKILGYLQLEIDLLNTETRIKTRVRHQIEKNQKDYYLNEQLKAIQKELGEEDFKEEAAELENKIKHLKLTKEAREKAEAEIKKLKFMNPMSSEASVVRNYLDWIINTPWKVFSPLNKNIIKAQEVLDKDHYGLEKIKERILEYLAVNLRTNALKSPVICLVGPPGVGKTSLVKSIAKATGREFVKVSLGGLRDEAEIKGHRRTYIGAMPGKIIQGMKKAKKSNPVMLLDEIDKMSFDYRGDPSSAMLEVLDPEQNNMFSDHYLEVDYDLSQVMFVATANGYDGIPRPLMDRMEIISLSGYTEKEKLVIAENYLIPKELSGHGAKENEVSITTDAVLDIIRYYTREAGVRGLNRNIAKVIRKSIRKILSDETIKSLKITSQNLGDYLGVRKYQFGEVEKDNLVGITNGLAYSEVGGDLLSIEAVLLYGRGGDLKITGKLGDVMKESAQTALSYIRSKAVEFGIKPNIFKLKDIHIHVPEGATPKDGPSAGIAISTSLVSVLTGIPVRRDIAMTGEITLRGRVLPIGGLKEKLLAALRGGVKTVLIPSENVKDLEDIPENMKSGLEIIPVERAEEVFKVALTKAFTPIIWNEEEELAKQEREFNNLNPVVAH